MFRYLFLLTCFVALGIVPACNDQTNPSISYVPDVPVNITINTDLPLYYHLQIPGNYTLLEGGHRGIFFIHHFDDNYYAVERTCSYQSDLSCAVIQIDSTNIQLKCGTFSNKVFESCCESQFSFEGFVIQGPATLPLKQYQVFKNGSLLTIRN